MRPFVLLALLIALAGCASRHEAPACSGDVFAINPVGAHR